MNQIHEFLMHSVYFAPRGKRRIHELGEHLAQRYMSAEDLLVGVIGDAGAGKSLLIQGMFPGLELSNDDERINIRPLPLLSDVEYGAFEHHTYHLDMLFEQAFTQPGILADAVNRAIADGCRVVVEHFDLLYPYLHMNARILVGIGEEVIIARPGLFGPEPEEIRSIVYPSLYYRKMAHSAEDITQQVLSRMGMPMADDHGDVRHGFMLCFSLKHQVDLALVERLAKEIIDSSLPITPVGEKSIHIGDYGLACTGPRIHVRNTGEIKNFRLLPDFVYNPHRNEYGIVGFVGEKPINFLAGSRIGAEPLF